MIKSLIVSGAVATAAALASPVVAGPYVNIENNGGYNGGEFLGSTTDFHVGFEGSSGVYSYYVQGGPAYTKLQDVDGETELSGKIGGNVQATDNFGVYAELSFITSDDDPNYGTKLGAKWNF